MNMAINHMAGVALISCASLLSGTAVGADVSEGQRIYQMHCMACHGATGESMIPNAPNFARGEGLMQADVALMATIRTGRMAMPAFAGVLRDQQIFDVIAYLRTFQR